MQLWQPLEETNVGPASGNKGFQRLCGLDTAAESSQAGLAGEGTCPPHLGIW